MSLQGQVLNASATYLKRDVQLMCGHFFVSLENYFLFWVRRRRSYLLTKVRSFHNNYFSDVHYREQREIERKLAVKFCSCLHKINITSKNIKNLQNGKKSYPEQRRRNLVRIMTAWDGFHKASLNKDALNSNNLYSMQFELNMVGKNTLCVGYSWSEYS